MNFQYTFFYDISSLYSRFVSNLELHAGAQYGRPGLTFHNAGNEHYNVLDFHSIIDPVPHGQLPYQDQTDGGNVDTEFAYDPPCK
jgi:hypothetical protein